MTSVYQQSIPMFVKYLKGMSALLQKGVAFCDEKGLKHEDMLNYRLVPDMKG